MLKIFLALALSIAQIASGYAATGKLSTRLVSSRTIGSPSFIRPPVSLGSSLSSAAIRASWTLTTITAIPAGALVVICAQIPFNAGGSITGVSDGTNTYTAAVTNAYDGATQLVGACYYKENATAVPAGATITVTLSTSTNASVSIINAAYIVGTIVSSSLDKSAGNLTNNATAYSSTTTGTLSQTNEIAIGFVGMYNASATITEGSGFTNINTTSQGSGAFFQSRLSYQIVSATTALNYQPSASVATYGKTLIATFKGF